MPVSYLDGSPFQDCFIPGLILLIALGVFLLDVLVGVWLRLRPAWYGAIAVGCGLIIPVTLHPPCAASAG